MFPFYLLSNPIIENKGQIKNTDVKYYSNFGDWVFYFLDDRIAVVKSKTEQMEDRNLDICKQIRWDLVPQFSVIKIETGEENKFYENHIIGNKKIKAGTFRTLKYTAKEFDIIFYTDDKNGLKFDFIYHNESKKGKQQIHFITEGSSGLKIINDAISIESALGSLLIQIPLAYSDHAFLKNTNRKSIPVKPIINEHEFIYEFNTDETDKEIIIDPWATFAGGSDVDEAYGSAFDNNGNIYISGYCSSLDLPVTTGVIQTIFNGLYDAFVFKFAPNGTRIWSTYYGGTNNDFGYKIGMNSNNEPLLSGYTYSNDLLVSSSSVFSSSFTGVFDAFILILKDDGTFDKATYYGGTGGEFVTDMDILNDEIIIGGFTSSNDLPVYSGAWQPVMGGALDIFIVKFDSTLNRIWDTYYGGTNSEDAHSVSFDPFGNVIISGDTYSNDFPVSVNAYQNSYTNGNDICLVKFDADGNMIWSTYFGSMANEDCEAIDCDEFGNIYFAGYVNGSGLPITAGLFMDTYSGDRDIIFGEFSPGGDLRWTTYAGGTAWDFPRDIQINEGGKIMITGESYSTDFPEFGDTLQSGNNGNSDVVYIVADSTGNVTLSTLWGGSGSETGNSVSFDGLFKTALTGTTSSNDLDVDSDIFQPSLAGQTDAFLKITDSTAGVFLSNPYQNFSENSFLLYPNPVNNELILSDLKKDVYLIRIIDLSGKIIYQKKEIISYQFRITEIPGISSGQYMITLEGKENYYHQKFIKF